MPRPATSRSRGADWPERLAAFIAARRDSTFEWGTHDCVTVVADAIQEMIGIDPIPTIRGTYGTEGEAQAIIDAAGGLEAMVASILASHGLPECAPRFAQRGDAALVQFNNQLMMGVVMIGKVAVPGPDRLQFAPLSAILRAWAI